MKIDPSYLNENRFAVFVHSNENARKHSVYCYLFDQEKLIHKKILEINYTKILRIRSNGDRLCISYCDLNSVGSTMYKAICVF